MSLQHIEMQKEVAKAQMEHLQIIKPMKDMIKEMDDLENKSDVVAATFGEAKAKTKKSFNHKICFWTKGVIALSLVFIVVLGISISINYNSLQNSLSSVKRLHTKDVSTMRKFDDEMDTRISNKQVSQGRWAYAGNDLMMMFNSNPELVKDRVPTMIEDDLVRIFKSIPSNADY